MQIIVVYMFFLFSINKLIQARGNTPHADLVVSNRNPPTFMDHSLVMAKGLA